jgi:hypothetical protein
MLMQIADYSRSPLSPVLFQAGTADTSQTPPKPDSVQPILDLPRVLKFRLQFHREADSPDHWLFSKEKQSRSGSDGPKSDKPISNPTLCARLRRQTINVGFPVSRERIRRAGLIDAVRKMEGFASVGADQVRQAAINLILSAELSDGQLHYATLGPDHQEKVWNHILDRIERCDDENKVANLDPATVAGQIKLDVFEVLNRRGTQTKGMRFKSIQALFRRMGYVSD